MIQFIDHKLKKKGEIGGTGLARWVTVVILASPLKCLPVWWVHLVGGCFLF